MNQRQIVELAIDRLTKPGRVDTTNYQVPEKAIALGRLGASNPGKLTYATRDTPHVQLARMTPALLEMFQTYTEMEDLGWTPPDTIAKLANAYTGMNPEPEED